MIEGQTVLALITARGGSTGLPRKNLRMVNGRSLLARAVACAQESETVDRIVLSSDDAAIIQAALLTGCEVPFVRPEELAGDEVPSIEVIRHALAVLPERYDYMVLLQPTSPLRAAEDVDSAVRLCLERNAPACVSVTPADKPPYWMQGLDEAGRLRPILPDHVQVPRRQALPASYAVNGAVYVARYDWLFQNDSFLSPETVAYVMPRERSIDIDEELDLVIASAMERWSEREATSVAADRSRSDSKAG